MQLTSVHLQLFLTSSEVAITQLGVVLFVCHLAEEIDAMKLVEDLKTNSIALNPGLRVNGSQVSFRHADYIQFFICNYLVTNYDKSVFLFCKLPRNFAYYRMRWHATLYQLQDQIQRTVTLLPSCC